MTNKGEEDILDNNILQIARFVGEDKFQKIILKTDKLKEKEFVFTPHEHPTQITLEKNVIIHYHCWVNRRLNYHENMEEIDFLR